VLGANFAWSLDVKLGVTLYVRPRSTPDAEPQCGEESIRMNREWQRKATQRQVIAFIILAVLIATFFWPYARH
jgi:hypothetical protein